MKKEGITNKKRNSNEALVVLVIPPSSLNKIELVSTQYPINLGYISSYLKKYNNAKIVLLDYNVLPYSDQSFSNKIKEIKPNIIGFGCMTINIKRGHHLARIAKKVAPTILTVIAGPHSTALPKETLEEFPDFDIVVIGEGESTISELCDRYINNKNLSGCLGIAHKLDNEIVIEPNRPLIENLDTIPFPDRDLLDLSLYKRSHASRGLSRKFLNITEIMVSRGCPYECIFCASHLSYKRVTRFRSAENVIAELNECIQKYGTTHFSILDDTFTINHNLIYTLCKEFKKLGVTWDCNTRVTHVNQELLNTMGDSGCIKVSFGVETGSQRITDLNKKLINIQQVRNAFKMAHKAKIKYVEGTFMIGSHPDEKPEDVMQTIKLIKEINPDIISLAIIVPLPGTYAYDLMKESGLIYAKDWDEFMFVAGKPKWRTNHFSSEELVTWQKKVLMSFYLRPNYIIKIISQIRSLGELKYWADIGIDFFKNIVFQKKTTA